MQKKRHHYLPKAYLKFFCDEQEKVHVYLKDEPSKVVYQSPNNTGFHKYYYSQPLPEGGKDHNTLEDLFSKFEGKWPSIVERIRQKDSLDECLEDLYAFIALQRIRVPATRDAIEKMRAEEVKVTARALDIAGKLPPKPEGFEDILDHVEVSIDPHQSIHAMAHMLPGIGRVLDQMGIGALYNSTDIPLLTSDNPVVWFDPSVPESKLRPYTLQPGGPVVLLFPITPNLVIYGDSSMRGRFVQEGFSYGELSKRRSVKIMNRQICRFAYKAVFAQQPGQEALIRKYADVSPVLLTKVISVGNSQTLLHEYVFGKRERKPKWNE